MNVGPKHIQLDNVDRVPQAAQSHDSAPWQQQRRWYPDWRALAVLCAFALLALLILYWLFGRDLRDWISFGNGAAWLQWLLWLAFGYILVRALTSAILKAILIEQRGYKVPIWNAHNPDMLPDLVSVDLEYAKRLFPVAAQVTNTTVPPMLPDPDVIDADIVPEEDTAPVPLPSDEWIPWFDARPHGLLAAETGGGKSTLFKLIAKSRIERGELVFLLDPHSSDWFGLPAIGGGEDWEAIWCGMQVVIDEYKARLHARDQYLQQRGVEMPTEHFPRITVLLDEANTACRKFSVAKRGQETRWEQFAEALGSGARKVGISIQLLAQSPVVEDLEMTRPMLNNFTRICLDSYTVQLLISKSLDSREQKQALMRAVQGQAFPAATTIKGYAVLLDRTGLDRVAPPIRPERAIWQDGYQRAERLIAEMRAKRQPARPVVSASVRPSATASASFSPADLLSVPAPDGRTTDGQRTRLYLKAMAAAGKTREYARDRMTALNMPFENSLWTEVRKELGLN